ncbi:MAG: hypothetical protein V4654_01575 [Bdellovibrionota bacterium]
MQEYIKYLKNVLGVSQILRDESPRDFSASEVAHASKISVWVENYDQFTTDDHTLLNNMLAAMKIPNGDMVVSDLSLKVSGTSQIAFDLVLSPDASGNQTYSPQVLHANKNLKSTVWTFLQTIMQKYKSLS